MSHPTSDATADLRQCAYRILTVIAVAICVAKIVGAENVWEPSRYKPAPESYGHNWPEEQRPTRTWPRERPEPTPMFSSNDKSRWATIRALVEEQTYVIGKRENFRQETGYTDSGIIFENGYQSLDKVMNPETGEFYSSKPPLFPTVLAGEYWVLKTLLGWNLTDHRWMVVCTMLITINVIPFAVYLILLARLIDHYGKHDFTRLFAFSVAAMSTYVLTFSATLNNHLPGIYCVLFAVYPLLRPRAVGETETRLDFALSGLFSALAVTFELPAAAFAAGVLVPLLIHKTRQTVLWFIPPMILVAIAYFGANIAALGTWKPAYSDFGGPWYEYPGSHWLKLKDPVRPKGIDFADEPWHVYLFHLTFGHHGWFSLTPVWLLSLGGMLLAACKVAPEVSRVFRRQPQEVTWSLPLLMTMTLAVSVVVFAFFTYKTNNYGGFTSGLRWVFWLTPLWILAMLPVLDAFAGKKGMRTVAGVLLAFSVLSVFYPAWNPWRAPWILQLCERQGWLSYGP